MPGVSAINAHICACISVGKPGYGIVVTSMGRRVALPLTRMLPLLRVTCTPDRKSTRLNSSHVSISYAAFCLKKITQPIPLLHRDVFNEHGQRVRVVAEELTVLLRYRGSTLGLEPCAELREGRDLSRAPDAGV